MTRMSVAELTLKKQITRIERDMSTAAREREAFAMQYNLLYQQREAIEAELDNLASARKAASAKRKPQP